MKLAVPVMGCFLVALLVLDGASAAPPSPDYDSIRDLYELLMGRDAQQPWDGHKLVRKSPNNRSPQLRLRFGRRSDPSFLQMADHGVDHSLFDTMEN